MNAYARTVCGFLCAATVVVLGRPIMSRGLSDNADGHRMANYTSTCVPQKFFVRAAPADPRRYTIAASLCNRYTNGHRKHELLVITIPGATYNKLYWNWPQQPERYSFTENLRREVSILNIDRLGTGGSSHPPSEIVDGRTQAYLVHRIVQIMRRRGFEKIVLAGHSLGSGVVVREAATYRDVDGIIVTGFLHGLASTGSFPSLLYPAASDPRFASLMLDSGYLTTLPGTRSNDSLYNPAAVDPEVVAFDEDHKDVVAATDIEDFVGVIFDPSLSQSISVPVLSIVGTGDRGFCEDDSCPLAQVERSAWSPAVPFELCVIPDAGHNIHLHKASAAIEYAYVRKWLKRYF